MPSDPAGDAPLRAPPVGGVPAGVSLRHASGREPAAQEYLLAALVGVERRGRRRGGIRGRRRRGEEGGREVLRGEEQLGVDVVLGGG